MVTINKESILFSRRAFIGGVAATSALMAVNPASVLAASGGARSLAFKHTHTGEAMEITYWANGGYIKDGLKRANYLLRDFRSGEQATMDPHLLDKLARLQRMLGSDGTFEIISAYRSPQTNAMLRKKSRGVAKNSYHLQAKAIDIRLTGVDLPTLRKAAIDLGGGGVGIYRGADFLHLDTGPERSWG